MLCDKYRSQLEQSAEKSYERIALTLYFSALFQIYHIEFLSLENFECKSFSLKKKCRIDPCML